MYATPVVEGPRLTHTLARAGMRDVGAELVFACPNFYVFLVNGQERTLLARDGKVIGFTVRPIG